MSDEEACDLEAWIEALGCDPRCWPRAQFQPGWTETEWTPGRRVPTALTPPREAWPALLPNRLGRNGNLHYFRPCQSPMEREEVARALASALVQRIADSLRGAGLAAYVRNGAVVAQGPHEGD